MQHFALLTARWSALSKSARIASIACFAAIVVAIVAVEVLAHPVRVALFATPLHAEQIAEVEERLAGWNVPFTPSADNVVVDASRRSDLLLRLSLSGVPHAHLEDSGEALANVGMLTPQTVIDAQARAGLAGDIETGLRGIDGVEDARVIVAPAKVAEFADNRLAMRAPAYAYVCEAASRLSPQAVQGIRAFVAAAVPGLDPARVTLLDDRGFALDQTTTGGDDDDVRRSLQSALDDAFGEGSAIVRVRAERSVERSSERNVERRPAGESISYAARSETYDADGKRYRLRDESGERGDETRETQNETPAGAVRRMSAAVFVDASKRIDVAAVRELAAATIGLDSKRGDTLSVQAVDFGRVPVARKDPWWLLYGTLVPLLPALAIGVAGRPFRADLDPAGDRVRESGVGPRFGATYHERGSRFRARTRAHRARTRTAACSRSDHQRAAGGYRSRGARTLPADRTRRHRSTNAAAARTVAGRRAGAAAPACLTDSFRSTARCARFPNPRRYPALSLQPSRRRIPVRAGLEDAASEARRFRAALADALAFSLERLVRDIACDVLARELVLAPPDVAAIAARALERYLEDGPLQVRVHPDDRGACAALDLPVVADVDCVPATWCSTCGAAASTHRWVRASRRYYCGDRSRPGNRHAPGHDRSLRSRRAHWRRGRTRHAWRDCCARARARRRPRAGLAVAVVRGPCTRFVRANRGGRRNVGARHVHAGSRVGRSRNSAARQHDVWAARCSTRAAEVCRTSGAP